MGLRLPSRQGFFHQLPVANPWLCDAVYMLVTTLDAPSFADWAESAAIPGKQPASQSSQEEPESSQGGAASESSQEQGASQYEQYRHK